MSILQTRIDMHSRSNKNMEWIVTKGIEMSLKGDPFSDTQFLRENGVPFNVMARVLFHPKYVRNLDVLAIKIHSNRQPTKSTDQGIEFEVLSKPYKLSDLAKKVRTVLEGPTVYKIARIRFNE